MTDRPVSNKKRWQRKIVRISVTIFFLLAFSLAAFWLLYEDKPELVPEPYRPTDAHDAYRHALVQAGLDQTALGGDWLAIAEKSLSDSLKISLPYEESFYMDATVACAIAYEFDVRRGRRMEAVLTLEVSRPLRVFVDLFRKSGDERTEWSHVASAVEDSNYLEFEPRRDGSYTIRIQPELLRGGQGRILIREAPILAFPVRGFGMEAVGSGFGAPRDGGRRRHEGLDVFAPRHTPVIAPVRAFVHHVGQNRLGGNTVWLSDPSRHLYYYFAHLETQDVSRHTWIEAGTQIGTVGNSGNARTTPPHLHFSVSAGRGFMDPHFFLAPTRQNPSPIVATDELLGMWARTSHVGAKLLPFINSPSNEGVPLGKDVPIRILGAAADCFRVSLPDGQSGYVSTEYAGPGGQSLRNWILKSPCPVWENPSEGSVPVVVLETGGKLEVLGKYGDYWMVRTRFQRPGWVSIPVELRTEMASG